MSPTYLIVEIFIHSKILKIINYYTKSQNCFIIKISIHIILKINDSFVKS